MFWSKKGPEKLKKIPYDLVSYIAIETDAIQDNNDRQMLSSYCLNKLETVKWYYSGPFVKDQKGGKKSLG